MKNVTYFMLLALVLFASAQHSLAQQGAQVFNRFDFNQNPVTRATIGPNGISADPDAELSGGGARIDGNCGGEKGIDLVANNSNGIYNQASLGMVFRYRNMEARSDFFVRGGTAFYQDNGFLYVRYRTTNGGSGYTDYGPFNTGYVLPYDNSFHIYTFVYTQADGMAAVTVDGIQIWTYNGPNNRPLYWTGAGNPVIASVMDGNCTGPTYLDYAYFYIPATPLPVEFTYFDALSEKGDVYLKWKTADASLTQDFLIERSTDGENFTQIAKIQPDPSLGDHAYTYTDVNPGSGEWFFRIKQQDAAGEVGTSVIRQVTVEGPQAPAFELWPNPLQADRQLQLHIGLATAQARILIYNTAGTLVLSQPATSGNASVDLSQLPSGLYIAKFQDNQTTLTHKLLIH